MGSISGILNLNNRPVDKEMLIRMNNLNLFRGPDRDSIWIDGNIGLGSRILFTTIESTYEQQPSVSCDGNYLIVFDGILYNRNELIGELKTKNILKNLFTDSELIVNLFALFELNALKKLNGDYSFVIWDIKDKKIICVRDHLGIQPFYYYYKKNKHFLFASQINQLLCINEIFKSPNETYIGETILNISSNDEETLYENIYRLPPANCLIVNENKIRRFRYWNIDPTYELNYKNDSEYNDNFFDLFSKSVNNCLRSNSLIGTTLSGGLDSSSVTSLANNIINNNHKNDLELSIFSLIFPELDCDESNYISDLSDHINKPIIKIEPKFEDYNWCQNDIDLHMTLPFFPNLSMCKPIYERLKEKGIRVMLTGQGGDEWLRGCYFYLSDLLILKKFDHLFKEIKTLYNHYGLIESINYLFAYLLKPSIPRKTRNELRKIINYMLGNIKKPTIPEWVNKDFETKIRLNEKINSMIDFERFRLHSHNHNYNRLHDFRRINNQEDSERFTSYYSVQDRHPFNNKELVEFCFSIPENKKINNVYTKMILRKSMKNHLPQSIQNRKTKAYFSQLILNTLIHKEFYYTINNLKIAEIGWINKKSLLNEYIRMLPYFKSNNPLCYKFMWQMGLVYSTEMWFRKIFVN